MVTTQPLRTETLTHNRFDSDFMVLARIAGKAAADARMDLGTDGAFGVQYMVDGILDTIGLTGDDPLLLLVRKAVNEEFRQALTTRLATE